MKTMSPEAERVILQALEKVAQDVNSGASPNDAIAKAASMAKLIPGHVNLMVTAYNVGRSEAQRKSSTDPLEKAAEFELADYPTIINKMYPDSKSEALSKQANSVSPEYSGQPRFLKPKMNSPMTKVAFQVPISAERTMLPETATRKAYASVERLKREMADKRAEAQETFDGLLRGINKLAALLADSRPEEVGEVRENAGILFGTDGAGLIVSAMQRKPWLQKKAVSPSKLRPINVDAEPYLTLRDCLAKVAQLQSKKEAFHKAAEAYEKADQDLKDKASEQLSFGAPVKPGNVLEVGVSKQGFFGNLFGAAVGSAAAKELGSTLGGNATADLRKKVQDKLTDPTHDATIRNIRTEAMLNDLLANDEIISGYDPSKVLAHYNEISQLAPRASSSPGLMRTMLRMKLQKGALDAFDIDQLLKIESSLKGQSTSPPSGVLAPAPSPGT
jgi:hypothetical protein